MVDLKSYGDYETAWCPGCGNFAILKAMKRALVESDLEPHDVLFVSGIGQAAKAPHYLNANVFNGLHGRALPSAIGAKLANSNLKVIAESGEGCNYGEGGNHFLAAIRRNVDITLIVHDNQIYGLTKGQASPTTDRGFVTSAQPSGLNMNPFRPLAVAVTMGASFVARSFSGMEDHLVDTLKEAMAHKGFSIVDILQPCVSFNKVNNFAWYKKRCKELGSDYNPSDQMAAIEVASRWGDEIPIGTIYKNDSPTFEDNSQVLQSGPLKDIPVPSMNDILCDYT
jgi:2-oxoglutarate/2-oxoacid ferredoxin oxidoreductase subunit beta